MTLRTKFNLAILIAFLIGFVVTGFLLKQHFDRSAKEEVLQTARVMLAAANAVRDYTTAHVRPLTGTERDGVFLSESIPSFAAQTNFRGLGTDFADYRYKEAALNPTNPADRATDWEADIINDFRANPQLLQISTERGTPTGETMNLAHPIRVTDDSCLTCHSVPSAAPASMTRLFGTDNGFGWHRDEIIGAQIVSLPLGAVMAASNWALVVFLALLTGVFLLMLVVLNILLNYLVIGPVKKISGIATDVSLGNMAAGEFEVAGKDEISALAAAFNRMRRSLESAMAMLQDGEPPRS